LKELLVEELTELSSKMELLFLFQQGELLFLFQQGRADGTAQSRRNCSFSFNKELFQQGVRYGTLSPELFQQGVRYGTLSPELFQQGVRYGTLSTRSPLLAVSTRSSFVFDKTKLFQQGVRTALKEQFRLIKDGRLPQERGQET